MFTHKHHIIPRHEWKKRFENLNGFNASDNIVYLTTEQHAEAHKFLFELNQIPYDLIAFQTLSGQIGKEEATRRASSFANIGNKNAAVKGRTPWNKGIKTNKPCIHSLETIEKIRAARKHQKPPVPRGTKKPYKQYSEERRAKKLALVQSPEHREKMRQARLRYLESRKVAT